MNELEEAPVFIELSMEFFWKRDLSFRSVRNLEVITLEKRR